MGVIQTCQVGFVSKLLEGVLMAPLNSRYTQVGFNLISAQVCSTFDKEEESGFYCGSYTRKMAGGKVQKPVLLRLVASQVTQ